MSWTQGKDQWVILLPSGETIIVPADVSAQEVNKMCHKIYAVDKEIAKLMGVDLETKDTRKEAQ